MSSTDAITMPTTEPDDDGFYIPNEMKTSVIPNAGTARFFVAPHKKGTVVRKQVIGGPLLKAYRNVQDITDAGLDMVYLGHFGHSTPKECALHQDVMFVNNPPMHAQHSADSNNSNIYYIFTETDKICILRRDVEAGEEFMQDYTNFKEVKWFEDYLNAKSLVCPRQFGVQLEESSK